jgi:TonB family protein
VRAAAPLSCLLLLLVADRGATQPTNRSPFASWAADVASPSRSTAAAWLGRAVPDDVRDRQDRARPLHAALDRSGPLVGADDDPTGTTGRGTLVAIVDSGVDFAHPALLDADGRPRIVWYLDLTLPSRGGAALDDRGGALFSRDELAHALRDPAAPRPSPDLTGHGTRVASVAAGDDAPYRGLAPGAELLVVRADRLPGGRYDEADVADAVAFAFDAATALGRPCVVNLSLGGQAGAHDGSSWLERAIDDAVLEGPGGRAVVVAAGNDGEAAVHARLEPSLASSASLELVVPGNAPLSGAPAAVVLLDLWSSPGRTFSLSVTVPDGTTHVTAPGDPPLELTLADGASLRLEPPADDRIAGRRTEALLGWTGGTAGSVPPGRYVVAVHGDAAVDAWLAVEARTTLLPFRLQGAVVTETTVAIPGTARGAITVGSNVSRSAWSNHLGDWIEWTAAPTGSPSGFTGRGPTADARFKPDLAAPGEWILGAQSADAAWPVAPGGFPATGTDPRWSAGRGTSLAAPHVTGAVARLFEREPWLPATEVLDRLRASTHGDGRWDPALGFGQLDLAALLAPLPPAPAAATVALSLARPVLPLHGPRTTEVAVLQRSGTEPVDGSDCFLRWPAVLAVSRRTDRRPWIGVIDASRLAPGQCAELVAGAGGDVVARRELLCVADEKPAGCGIAPVTPDDGRRRPLWWLCLLGAAVGWRGARRRQWPFLVASVAAHLLLLGLLAWWLPALRAPVPAPLVAVGIVADVERSSPPPPPPPPAPPPPPSPPASSVRIVAPAPTPVVAAANPVRRPRRAADRQSSGVAPTGSPAAVGLPEGEPTEPLGPAGPALPAAAADAGPPAPPPTLPPPAPVGPVVDPCAEAASALRARIDEHKRYPPLARRRGSTGTTVVAFALDGAGNLARLDVVQTSGVSLLDEAALAAVRAAVPFPAAGCSFVLPLQFRLEAALPP